MVPAVDGQHMTFDTGSIGEDTAQIQVASVDAQSAPPG